MRALSWRRLGGPASAVAVTAAVVAAVAEAVAATVVGRVAAEPAVVLVTVLAALLLGAAVLDTVGRVLFAGVVSRAEGGLRADLVDAALAQPLPRLEDQAVGELLDRVDDDARQLAQLFRRIGWETGRALLRSVLAWLVAGLVFWPAWIAFPLVAGLIVLVARPLTPVVARAKVAEEAAWSDHSAQLEEAIAGQDDVRTSLGQPHVVAGFAARAAEVLRRVRTVCRAATKVGLRTGFVAHAVLGAVALGGVWLVAGDPGGIAALVSLWILVTAFVSQVDAIVDRMPDIQAGLGALTRVRSLLHAEREPAGGAPLPPGPAGVELRGLSAGYDGGFRLAGIDLVVPAGTTCALLGRTGSGKSTVTKVLSRAVEPPRGQVFVGGQDVCATGIDDLRRGIGVVTQRTEVLAATLAENVTLFDPAVTRSAVEVAVSALDLDGWVAALPDGLDTRLGTGGVTLSAGEQQLVAFARLLVRDVAVVVLDEATARMDPRTEERVTRASRALLAGRTGIVVAHRLSTVRRADAVAVLEDGRLVQHGDRARLAGEPGRYAELLEADGDDPADRGPTGSGPGDGRPGNRRPDDRRPSDGRPSDGVPGHDGPTATTGPDCGAGAAPGPSPPAPATAAAPGTGPPARSATATLAPAERAETVHPVPTGTAAPAATAAVPPAATDRVPDTVARRTRRTQEAVPAPVPALWRTVLRLALAHKRWGLAGGFMFTLATLAGASGVVTGWLWGHVAGALQDGATPWGPAVALTAILLLFPLWIAVAFRTYPLWWSAVTLRTRLAVLRGQTMQHRGVRAPAGEVVARALDSDRMTLYVDRWVDVANAGIVVVVAGLVAGDVRVAAVVGAFLLLCAGVAAVGAPFAGRAGRVAADARARFGTALGSALDAVRTLKLAAATGAVRAHLADVDARRVHATVREYRIRTLLDGVPGLLVQVAVVLTWSLYLTGSWDLATALLVSTTLTGAGFLGQVCAAAVTEAPIARRWLRAVAPFAGAADLTRLPPGVDLVAGTAPAPRPAPREPLDRLSLQRLTAVHDDGTVGVCDIDLEVDAGSLVLVTGRVGAGKSSLLAALAGLLRHEGAVRWNGRVVHDAQRFLRPGQVAYVGQVPRVLSGTVGENITLGHRHPAGVVDRAVDDARLGPDLAAAGGADAVVGHRGIRLSGGQVQRLAMARALATGAELVVADDVSSALDVRTEIELWAALRRRGSTVVGASTKRAALARADRVVVLEHGRVAAEGPWSELAPRWSHLAG
ncbi:ABC-type multidrug transport system, ATPase and permease component [Pseudonocardia ammonioxydans]|uniref:ABC-type multidrug transport system, ATPase and permease component n=1 Tax=Pseudonocardia ammonioxydans TaxID=260086 RepID=A0A1I4VHX7_PSUAM|nr:ABC transporter ATP-binding protein [Pseudonocardia ammonioxydans]SFN00802.1 ABC-type multidrug transport system, ATPase and permease component [Pseudonocardia ammonioxydans]